MDFYKKYGSSESRREELIRKIAEHFLKLIISEKRTGAAIDGHNVALRSFAAAAADANCNGVAAVNNLTLEELEALHYDMMTKRNIND
ncbi:MAG: hypothetical protein J5545_09595 [Bacteroidaceae bacterium]|nr:hypothetical protein [Bacteroidaceae bacterium]